MSELRYQIDKEPSSLQDGLVIKIEDSEKKSLNKTIIQSLAKDADREVLSFIFNQKSLNPTTFKIPHSKSFLLIKLLAGTGRLYFQNRQLYVDLFSKNPFFYWVSQQSSHFVVSGKIRSNDVEIDIKDCDFVCAGSPHWYIKGSFLKIISSDVSWNSLHLTLSKNPWVIDSVEDFVKEMKDPDPDSPQIIVDHSVQQIKQREPLPLLILKDRSGAFADLWMTYEDIGKVPFHNPEEKIKGKRVLEAEKNWEKDLLETDFIRKTYDSSHYYCPVDKVGRCLAFLLELGWSIIDYNGKQVLNSKKASLHFSEGQGSILAHGKIHYGDFSADLSPIIGSFNRKERFISLGEGHVGLLPDKWQDTTLQTLCEEGEIVSDTARMSKSSFISLIDENESIHQFDPSLLEKLKSLRNISQHDLLPANTFKGILRGYQQEGLNWLGVLYRSGLHGLLADDMGLGKTVQVLAFISQIQTSRPCLIIMPSSLLFSWRMEIKKFLGIEAIVHQGPRRAKTIEKLSGAKIILCSYTILRMDLSLLSGIEYELLILDEAQMIKNSDTQVAQAVYALKAIFRLSLSGTPMENRLEELWSQFHFILPDLLGSKQDFASEIQAAAVDNRHLQKIKKKIDPFFLRRRKSEVAKDLPEKINQVVWVEMPEEQRRIYDDFLSGVRGNLLKKVSLEGVSQYRMEILEAILRLRQICCHPLLISSSLKEEIITPSIKMERLLDDLEVVIAEKQKALVYSQFASLLKIFNKEIVARGWKSVLLDGSTMAREKVVKEFQEDPECSIFLISLKAGGVGLNLTAADYVFLYEPWWNEAIENQAIDRAHRIGRKAPVVAKRYVVAESIEERMMKLKESKRAIIDDLFEGQLNKNQFTEENIDYLFS